MEREKLPAIFVDGGGLLFARNTIPARQRKQQEITARGIARAMKGMNCKALGIAAQDLAGGVALLKEIEEREKLPWLSMNLVERNNHEPVFLPSVHLRAGNTDITLLGLTDEQALQTTDRDKYVVLPWRQMLPAAVKKAEETPDNMIILVSSYPQEVNQEIAKTVPGIDLLIESGHTPGNRNPQQNSATLFAQVAAQGKYLGMMRINWTRSGKWSMGAVTKIRAEQNQLDRINWQLGRLEKRAKGKDLRTDKRYQNLLKARQESEQKIVALKKSREQEPDEPCTFSNRFIAIKSSIPEDHTVQEIIDQTTRDVNRINSKRSPRTAAGSRKNPLALLAGSASCSQCHPRQTAFWQTTGHAKAWQTLAGKHQQFNEDCLLCHVTLPFYDPQRISAEQLLLQIPANLQGVGCESCHGPALAHSRTPTEVRPSLPHPETCRQCHTPERDDNFVFAEKLKKVRCPEG